MAAPSINLFALFIPLVHILLSPVKLMSVPSTGSTVDCLSFFINIVATNVDTATIDKLRKALPKTKIDAKLEDLDIETVDTSQ